MSNDTHVRRRLSRRSLLKTAGLSALALVWRRSPVHAELDYESFASRDLCSPAVQAAAAITKDMPIVDVHCHIFNARDIPVFKFVDARIDEETGYDEDLTELVRFAKSLFLDKIPKALQVAVDYETEAKCLGLLIDEPQNYTSDRGLFPKSPAEYNVSALRKHINASFAGIEADDTEQAIIALYAGAASYLNIDKDELETTRSRALKAFNAAWLPAADDTSLGSSSSPESSAYATSTVPTIDRYMDRGVYETETGFAADEHITVRRLAWSLTRSRTRNFQHLRQTFGMARRNAAPGTVPRVQLFTPAMVDFDYWLNSSNIPARHVEGTGTRFRQTSLDDQVKLMGKIMRLYPGQMHPFVPFCPWRQADDMNRRKVDPAQSALGIVKSAIVQGFVGVKLYPPMGFRPIHNGNKDGKNDIVIPPHYKDLPLKKADGSPAEFGVIIDESLHALYDYCQSEDVPIMAHTAYSNSTGVDPAQNTTKGEYASPVYWKAVLEAYPCLRLNFAHFGFERWKWRYEIGVLMDKYENVYADLSFFDGILYDQCRYATCLFHDILGESFLKPRERQSEWIKEELIGDDNRRERRNCVEDDHLAIGDVDKTALYYTRGKKTSAGTNARWQRIMYGSDWSMLTLKTGARNYLDVAAAEYLAGTANPKWLKAFLGGNALSFLGLCTRSGGASKQRARIETFYAEKLGQSPDWIKRRFQWFDDLAAEIYA